MSPASPGTDSATAESLFRFLAVVAGSVITLISLFKLIFTKRDIKREVEKMGKKVDVHEGKLIAHERRLDSGEYKLQTLEASVKSIHKKLDNYGNTLQAIDKNVAVIAAKMEKE